MTAVAAEVSDRPTAWRALPWWSLVVVAVVAGAARLLPVMLGGGLFGLGDYDDGVYYSAAVGLVHGRLPYRDFLLLHPPGIVLALAPFAALGRLVGDPTGFALARLGWMVLGAVNAVLVARILKPLGVWAALLGGFSYAVLLPAIYGEHSTQLEGLENTCLLVAVGLLTRVQRRTLPIVALAGAALGLSTGVKIWGVAMVGLVAVWLLLSAGVRRAAVLLLGAVAGTTVICLPFFLAAPAPMWRMVVTDQLGRPGMTSPLLITRMTEILGLHAPRHDAVTAGLVAIAAVVALLGVLALRSVEGRLAVTLLAGLTVLLFLIPVWFGHYAALTAPPLALTIGYGVGGLTAFTGPDRGRWIPVSLLALLLGYAATSPPNLFNEAFPGTTLGAFTASVKGCVTSDDATMLVEMDVLGRNLERGCVLVVDLSGHSYDEPHGRQLFPRRTDALWQQNALAYFKTGTLVLVHHFTLGKGYSGPTAATLRSWPVVHRVGHFALRGTGSVRNS